LVHEAERISRIPPYLFARIEQKIDEAKAQGRDIISLGIGDPDRPTPKHIIEELKKQAEVPENHRYPSSSGLVEFRRAVADYYARRFGVELDPKREVVNLIGSKEGIGHIAFCYTNPGDLNLVPDPGYPVYGIGTLLAGGTSHLMPLVAERGFKPDLSAIPTEVAKKAKLLYLNYPNNPTGATADLNFFAEVVEFARQFEVIVCHDAAYTEIYFNGVEPPSFLETPGAKEVGIEFNSLSKPFNMTGWRVGWAAGRSDVIEVLGRLKSNLDSGQFQALQYAGIAALRGPQDSVATMREVYRERRDTVVQGLNQMGWHLEPPRASFYVWAPVPRGYDSAKFAEEVLEKAGVIITPGSGYGEQGEGYFRIALTIEKERIAEGLDRMAQALGKVNF